MRCIAVRCVLRTEKYTTRFFSECRTGAGWDDYPVFASLGTKETFLYLSLLLNLGDKVDALNQASAFAGAKILRALSDSELPQTIENCVWP